MQTVLRRDHLPVPMHQYKWFATILKQRISFTRHSLWGPMFSPWTTDASSKWFSEDGSRLAISNISLWMTFRQLQTKSEEWTPFSKESCKSPPFWDQQRSALPLQPMMPIIHTELVSSSFVMDTYPFWPMISTLLMWTLCMLKHNRLVSSFAPHLTLQLLLLPTNKMLRICSRNLNVTESITHLLSRTRSKLSQNSQHLSKETFLPSLFHRISPTNLSPPSRSRCRSTFTTFWILMLEQILPN
mmetsp:Transcript_9017/g.33248  ORF Transcript_9017/g.33248 Transcript_9017/m.33248 type:complete len:243 (-) Transcript_9017:3878-4606(-)